MVDGDFEITRTKRGVSYGKGIFDDEKARDYIGPRFHNVGVKGGTSCTKNRNFTLEKRKAREEIKLALASKGFMFGQEDVVNKRKYTTTVRCVSNEAHAYVINS